MRSAIRHLAVDRAGTLLAAAEFKFTVHLYDLKTLQPLRTVQTTLDFGGKRLALSPDAQTLVAGAYHVHGVAAYLTSTGQKLWRRTDLEKVQIVKFSPDGSKLFCCFSDRPCEVINPSSGESGPPIPHALNLWDSPFAPLQLVRECTRSVLSTPAGPIATIQRTTFAVLAAAFSPSFLCTAEAGGPLRAYDINTGQEIWRHVPPAGTHFLELAFSPANQCFAAVSYPYQNGGDKLLHLFNPGQTEIPSIATLHGSQTEFLRDGAQLVTSDGQILSISDGQIINTLPFPAWTPRAKSTDKAG